MWSAVGVGSARKPRAAFGFHVCNQYEGPLTSLLYLVWRCTCNLRLSATRLPGNLVASINVLLSCAAAGAGSAVANSSPCSYPRILERRWVGRRRTVVTWFLTVIEPTSASATSIECTIGVLIWYWIILVMRIVICELLIGLNAFKFEREARKSDRLFGLVVRVSGYRYRGLGFDSRHYHIFWVVVGLERGPLSLVRSIEELLE